MGLQEEEEDYIPQEGCKKIGAQNVITENTLVRVLITMKIAGKVLRDETYLDYMICDLHLVVSLIFSYCKDLSCVYVLSTCYPVL